MSFLEACDLVVHRGATVAVAGVALDIAAGSWIGVVGANGSGKTSLLRAVAGRLDIAAGSLVVQGEDRASQRDWRARFFGFAPDIGVLPEGLTGAELFAILAAELPGSAPGDDLRPLREALGIDPLLPRRIGTLSGGMRQRLALFCAFLLRPQCVILDEPFNWLDPVCAFDTKQALQALVAEQGLTLVTALHDMPTLLHHCRSGVLLAEGRVSRILEEDDLRRGANDYRSFEADMIAALRQA